MFRIRNSSRDQASFDDVLDRVNQTIDDEVYNHLELFELFDSFQASSDRSTDRARKMILGGREVVYQIIWKRFCSPKMRTSIRKLPNYRSDIRKDPIVLLKTIKGLMSGDSSSNSSFKIVNDRDDEQTSSGSCLAHHTSDSIDDESFEQSSVGNSQFIDDGNDRVSSLRTSGPSLPREQASIVRRPVQFYQKSVGDGTLRRKVVSFEDNIPTKTSDDDTVVFASTA
ncbi:MAG TPA: hypothetical protein VLS94_00705, partial [Fusibacter sp.]|nr:hypothetical protein [Fusibacter sp.]